MLLKNNGILQETNIEARILELKAQGYIEVVEEKPKPKAVNKKEA